MDMLPLTGCEHGIRLYVGDKNDVGIEILPMKSMQAQMSTGVTCCHEGGLYGLVRQGRGVPVVPLLIFGVAA